MACACQLGHEHVDEYREVTLRKGREGLDPDAGYYGYFQEFSPVARAGYSILIYHISLEEANQVRAKLGLPTLAEGAQP